MGREVKRVSVDFDWPINQIWKGFLIPEELHSSKCPRCDGSGQNLATKQIADDFYDLDGWGVRWNYVYGIGEDGKPAERAPWKIVGECRRWCNDLTQDEVRALLDKGRLMDLTHTWTSEHGWQPKIPLVIPTPQEVAHWDKHSMGHDAINRWTLIETRAKRLGVFGECDFCGGEGELWKSSEQKTAAENWTSQEPPAGEGWQMWETTSEGSPISPVFETPENLARWLADNNASTFGNDTTDYATWLKMIKGSGWAMSAVMDAKGFRSGVDAVAHP